MITILYILGGIVLLILILGMLAPKNYDVSRSIIVNKPKSEVFKSLRSLKKQGEWSPWEKKDPNMKKEFTGTDGEVGAKSAWVGNKEVGEGEQEITKIIEGERIEGKLRFFKPWKSEADCYFNVEDASGSGTNLTWGFSGKNKFPFSIFMLFFSMEKTVGKDFEEGLDSFKSLMET
jgi:hypothetical protein